MTKAELIGLWMNLNKLGSLQGVKFAYGVAKNINILQPEVETIQKTVVPAEEYIEYEKKRIAFCTEYSLKNENGTPIMVGNDYSINPEHQAVFDKEIAKIRKEYKTVIEARDKQIAEYTSLLNENSTVELYKIKLADLPETISTQEVTNLFNIIEE